MITLDFEFLTCYNKLKENDMRKGVNGFIVLDSKTGIGYECKDGLVLGHAVYLIRSNMNMAEKITRNVKDEVAVVYRAKSEEDLKAGREKIKRYLQNMQLDYHAVGILGDEIIKAHLIIPDEVNMCYETINYNTTRNLKIENRNKVTKQETKEDRKFYNPNLVEIKDIKFYRQMVETYRQLGTLPLKEPEKLKDAPIVEEFIKYYGESSRGMTDEQAEDFVNFTQVIAEHHLEDEAYNLPDKFYEYMDEAKKLQEYVCANNEADKETAKKETHKRDGLN